MGNPKQKWTSEEEEALRAGVAKHGAGKWINIQKDPEFNHLLFTRSNIDLKDKWRNLSVASGQLPRDKLKASKAKASHADAVATSLPIVQTSATVIVMLDPSRPLLEANDTAKYNEMIYEALSAAPEESDGSDYSTIASFIEQRLQVPQNFRRLLSSRLRQLVQQDKLEKVRNCYRIKRDTLLDGKSRAMRQKDARPRPLQVIRNFGDTMEEAVVSAAYKIAEAENKSFVAAEAVKEAERVSNMAEDMESLLQFASDCFDQCVHGEIVLMA